MARSPRPVTRHTREITITVQARPTTDGVVPDHVLGTLVDELVARVGTEANPNCVTVELEVASTVDTDITITVTVHSIINGVLQEYVMRTLVDELVARVGTVATPDGVTVELTATGELDVDRRTRGL
jgi:hypothetical protein